MNSPRHLRAEIARTREELSRHLDALRIRVLHPERAEGQQSEAFMPTKRASRRPSPSSGDDGGKTEGTKKSRKAASTKRGGETSRKKETRSSSGKKGSSSRTKSASKSKGKSMVAKTWKVLDTVLAGAVVGAVTGAARGLADEPSTVAPPETAASSPREAAVSDQPTPGKVLEEMAPGAAVGAVSGAVKAIVPPEPATRKRKKKR
jgi:hypothetical protein